MRLPQARRVRWFAVILAIPSLVLAVWAFQAPENMASFAHGPLLKDHEGITCAACHTPSPGTTRQQIQAKVHHQIGLRDHPVDFGYGQVSSDQCLACHARPNERHPIYRFREPRFSEAIAKVDATSCLGCHTEHNAERAFIGLEFCSACHGELSLKSDPISPSHVDLIAAKDWNSCLTCHDFHGNHAYRTPIRTSERFDVEAIRSDLLSGPSPYGSEKIFEGKSE